MTALHDHPAQPTDGIHELLVNVREPDVTELAVLSGRMLVFGPEGTLDPLAVDTDVGPASCRAPMRLTSPATGWRNCRCRSRRPH